MVSSTDMARHESTDAPEDAEGEARKPLSKNAQKRVLRQERWKAMKVQKKALEKEMKKQQTMEKRKEWEEKLESASAEERERLLEEQMKCRQQRKAERLEKKERLREAMDCAQNLVIDLEFCELMEPQELVSLVQQVMYSYAANAKASHPLRLSLTGCKGTIKDHLQRIPGFTNWLVHIEERSYLEVFQDRKRDLVYLTADSEHLLHQLDESTIYIIGGLVDRNRWKGLTYKKAKDQGILTAKLAISEHMKMSSSQVLTVNQVVEIVLSYRNSKDWTKALLEVIPQRKREMTVSAMHSNTPSTDHGEKLEEEIMELH